MHARPFVMTLILMSSAFSLWAPSGSGNRGQEYPFHFDVPWKTFQLDVLTQAPYKFNGPQLQFAPLLAYLYLQYAILTGLKKEFGRADEVAQFLTLNHVSHSIKPREVGQGYSILFESNVLGLRTPSSAAQAAGKLLGKRIADDLTPSPVLVWLESEGGLPYVEKYLNLVFIYLLNKDNEYQSKTEESATYLAPHLWRKIKLDKDFLNETFNFTVRDRENIHYDALKGSLFDIFELDVASPGRRSTHELKKFDEMPLV